MNESFKSQSDRIESIDALRGFDMFWIVGGDALARALCAWADSSRSQAGFWGWYAGTVADARDQFEHVAWHGFHFYDLIFPLFLFVVGCVLPISLAKHHGSAAYGRILRRTLALLALAFIYAGFLQLGFLSIADGQLHWDFSNTRFPGVLQRIAICYFVTALIVLHTKPWTQVFFVAAILLGYFGIFHFLAPPGGQPRDYSMETSFAGYIDRQVLGGTKLYYGHGDNEGLLSTLPAVATTLLGALAGRWLMGFWSPIIKFLGLAVVGSALVFAGWQWEAQLGMPVNKILWTSSFVLVTAGWSSILLAGFYLIVDMIGLRFLMFPFIVIGSNAIAIYMMRRFVDFPHMAQFFTGGIHRLLGETNPEKFVNGQAVLWWGTILALQWMVLYFLYRHRAFLRV